MTTIDRTEKENIKRCAVCKIDLKGRFVFVDDQVVRILGQSMEQLFGKPIFACLDKSGRERLKQLLASSSRYETSYESCRVNFIDSSGGSIGVNLIVSLSFAGGNPVNYQILIDPLGPESTASDDTSPTPADSQDQHLLEALVDPGLIAHPGRFIPALAAYIGEPRTVLYELVKGQLQPVPDQPEQLASISGVSDFHLAVLAEERTYATDNPEAVAWAIELTGSAPAEFLAPIGVAGTDQYLIRVILDEKHDSPAGKSILHRLRIAIELFSKQLGRNPERSEGFAPENSSAENNELFLEAFERLEIAAFLTDTQGEIITSNRTAKTEFDLGSKKENYRKLLMNTVMLLRDDDLVRLDLCLENYRKSVSPPKFEAPVLLPGQAPAQLEVIKLTSSASASELLFVFIPAPFVDDTQAVRQSCATARATLDSIESLGKIAIEHTAQLSHEYFNDIGPDGSFVLMCLSSCLQRMQGTLTEYKQMFETGSQIKRFGTTDLNLVVHQLVAALNEVRPNVRITITHGELPKVHTEPKILKIILKVLIGEVLGEWSGEDFRMNVNVTKASGELQLQIQLPEDSPRSALEALHIVCETSASPSQKGDPFEVNPIGLVVAQLAAGLRATTRLVRKKVPTLIIGLPDRSVSPRPTSKRKKR